MIKNRIERLARSLCRRYGGCGVFELCDRLGILVLWQELPDAVNGFYVRVGGRCVIVLSTLVANELRGYVCAHELGHVLLHSRTNAVELENLTNLSLPRLENEADYFAACLLLEDSLDAWRLSYDQLTLQQVARLSGVPERVVRLRFSQMGAAS